MGGRKRGSIARGFKKKPRGTVLHQTLPGVKQPLPDNQLKAQIPKLQKPAIQPAKPKGKKRKRPTRAEEKLERRAQAFIDNILKPFRHLSIQEILQERVSTDVEGLKLQRAGIRHFVIAMRRGELEPRNAFLAAAFAPIRELEDFIIQLKNPGKREIAIKETFPGMVSAIVEKSRIKSATKRK